MISKNALQRPDSSRFTGGIPKKHNMDDVIANKAYGLGYQQAQLQTGIKQFQEAQMQATQQYAAAIQQLFQLQAQNHAEALGMAAQLGSQPQQPSDSHLQAATGGALGALMGQQMGGQGGAPQQGAPPQGGGLPGMDPSMMQQQAPPPDPSQQQAPPMPQ